MNFIKPITHMIINLYTNQTIILTNKSNNIINDNY